MKPQRHVFGFGGHKRLSARSTQAGCSSAAAAICCMGRRLDIVSEEPLPKARGTRARLRVFTPQSTFTPSCSAKSSQPPTIDHHIHPTKAPHTFAQHDNRHPPHQSRGTRINPPPRPRILLPNPRPHTTPRTPSPARNTRLVRHWHIRPASTRRNRQARGLCSSFITPPLFPSRERRSAQRAANEGMEPL